MSTPPPPAPGGSDAGDLAAQRIEYLAGHLADDALSDPFALLARWLDDAHDAGLPDPSAAILSTIALDADGAPSPRSRTVLVKGLDGGGLTLFTNLDSAKGRELAATPRAALLLPWYALQRQIRIEGAAVRIPDEESDAYFATRPRGAQVGAWASQQSEPIASRAALEEQYARTLARFGGDDGGRIPRPPRWGGIRVVPERIEFWQGRANRFHDRIVVTRDGGGPWSQERLQP